MAYVVLSVADLLLINAKTPDNDSLYYWQPLHNVCIIAGCFAALACSQWIGEKEIFHVRGLFPQSSFVIFAFHSFLLYDISKMCMKAFFKDHLGSVDELLLYAMSITFTIVVCMFMYAIMKRSRCLSLLFIGR